MLLRRCLIQIRIIIPRHFLYLLYLCPCLDLGLFNSYQCHLFSIFIFIFIMINRMNIDALVLLLNFQNVSYYDNVDEESQYFSNSKRSASGCCLAFHSVFAIISLALLIKVLLIKKACDWLKLS